MTSLSQARLGPWARALGTEGGAGAVINKLVFKQFAQLAQRHNDS